MAYKRFSDEQQAMFIVQLEVLGYPDNEHAPKEVAKQKGAPTERTLRRWWKIRHRPDVANVVRQEKRDVVSALEDLLDLHIEASSEAVKGSDDLRTINTGIGILVDKLQLLKGQPTWRGEIIDLLKGGQVTPEELTEELGNELATELFNAAGIPRATG